MKHDWKKMRKNTCSSIVLSFTTILFVGCAAPLAQTKPDSVTTPSPSEIEHVIAPGDRLSDIALKYTGKVSLWKAIADYNNITDPRTLRIGDSVTIPSSIIPGHAETENNAIDLSTNANASANVATGTLALQRTRDTDAAAADVKVAPVTTNRSFQLERMDESDVGNTPTRGIAPPQVRVIGTYYPKGVYEQPASYSRLMMRVAPGTIFELDREVNDWYKVMTSEGTGYLRAVDGKLIAED